MKHWVFDLDGTLVDSFSHYFSILEDIFKAHGKQFDRSLEYAALTDNLRHFFAVHLGDSAVENALSVLQSRSNSEANLVKPFPGIEEILKYLKSEKMNVGVWTNRDLTSASLILKHSGLDRHIDNCISGTCVQEREPNPEGLERMIGHFSAKPAEVTMIGDHSYDVLAARKTGSRGVRASWHPYWTHPPCQDSDFQFHSVEEFDAWIRKG